VLQTVQLVICLQRIVHELSCELCTAAAAAVAAAAAAAAAVATSSTGQLERRLTLCNNKPISRVNEDDTNKQTNKKTMTQLSSQGDMPAAHGIDRLARALLRVWPCPQARLDGS
jgi:hypothetical protein